MKYTFVVTISPGYMFSLNSNFNTNQFYGTNADFHVLYHSALEQEYRDKCTKAFPFKIVWEPLSGSFFNAKYKYVEKIRDEYDAVCIIDGDLFICSNVKEYFEKAYNEKLLVASTHAWALCDPKGMPFGNEEKMIDRGICCLADLSVFFDPKKYSKFVQDWYNFTLDKQALSERNHPLVAFNRAICNNFTKEQIFSLDGDHWVCDRNYWGVGYEVKDNKMFNDKGERVHAIHNRWWSEGRAAQELRANRDFPGKENLIRGERNFNNIKDFMGFFNAMTPETKRFYYEEKIVKEEIWARMDK